MERIEALLTRKLVTSRELRALLPTVWWSGAQSQAGDDSRVSQSGFATAVEVGTALCDCRVRADSASCADVQSNHPVCT